MVLTVLSPAAANLPLGLAGVEGANGLVVLALVLVVGLVVGAIIGTLVIKSMGKSALAQGKSQAEEIVTRAKSDATELVKKAAVDGKAEYLRLKELAEKEADAARRETRESEQRLVKREDMLDKKLDTLSMKEKNLESMERSLNDRTKNMAAKDKQLDDTLAQQKETLLRITNMNMEEARQLLLNRIESEVRHDAAIMVQKIEGEAKDEAKGKATNILLSAMQRYAAEVTSEGTTKSVEIPSDDMKGRIIGREGRNIRAFEQATGVDVIIDDTPGLITVNCFDPVRREIAKVTMEKLIADGRIHPARIEELVELTQKEMDNTIRQIGKKIIIECNIPGLPPKISETLGRLHYRTSYGQNVLRHSVEVAFLSQMIADELGLDGGVGPAGGIAARHRQGDGPRARGRPPGDRDGVLPEVQRARGGAQRHRRAPQRHSGDHAVYADHHGGGCDQRGPAWGAALDAGALHQTVAGPRGDCHELPGRAGGVCDSSGARDPRDRRSGALR